MRVPWEQIASHTDEHIKGFVGPYRFLSNFYPATIRYEGDLYLTVENAYQAAKAPRSDSWPNARTYFKACSPAQAKSEGQRITLPKDWETRKLVVMRELLQLKFCPQKYPLYAGGLINTGDRLLEETNWWGDRFWGVCEGTGENHLGKILMEIRASIRRSDLVK